MSHIKKHREQPKYWFKRKKFGYGYQPASKEGWFVILGFAAALGLWVWFMMDEIYDGDLFVYFVGVFVLVVGAIFIFGLMVLPKGWRTFPSRF
jgi:hypothetical protein